MLRVTPIKVRGAAILKLEGKLCGPWVDELEHCWTNLQRKNGTPIRVSLQEVSFLDPRGKRLLLRMKRQGVSLVECPHFIRELLDPNRIRQMASRKRTIKKER